MLQHVPGRSLWIAFKYEKLPKFCYRCDIILHGQKGCSSEGNCRSPIPKGEPYGPCFRVIFPTLRGIRGDAWSGRNQGVGDDGENQKERPYQVRRNIEMEHSVQEEAGDGGTTGSEGLNPSKQVEALVMNSEHNSWDRINAGDTCQIGLMNSTNGSHMVRHDSREPFSLEGRDETDPSGIEAINGPNSP